MIRAILGILASYAVMAVVLIALSLGGFVALGVDRFFQPDIYEVSILWMVISLCITAGTGTLGGLVCVAISRSVKTCEILAVLVFGLHFVFCFSKMREEIHVRAGDVPVREVMNLAQMPLWMDVLTPTIGAIGVLIGARIKMRTRSDSF